MDFSRIRARLVGGEASAVFRGMATLAMGTGAAKLIGIAAIPLLTRLYSPEDFGVLSIYVALVLVIAPVLTLRYVQAVPLPKTDAMAANLVALSASLLLVVSGLLIVILWLLGPAILRLMSMDKLVPWWWLIVLGAMAAALYEMLSVWAIRKKAYRIIAKTQFTQSLVGEGLKLLLGLLAFKPLGLLLGQIATQGGGIGSFLVRFREDIRVQITNVASNRMWLMARYYGGFPAFRLPSQFLMVLSVQAPLMIASVLYGSEVTGQLGLALTALALPVNLIGHSIGQAFYGEIADIGKKDLLRIRKLSYAIQGRLFVVGIPIAAVLFVFGEYLFRIIFGSDWVDAGRYASLLAPFVLMQFTSAPLIQVLNIFNFQIGFFLINLLRIVGILVVFYLASYFDLKEEKFVLVISCFLFLFYGGVSAFVFYVVDAESKRSSISRGRV